MSLGLVAGESENQGGPLPVGKLTGQLMIFISWAEALGFDSPPQLNLLAVVSFDPTKAFEPDGARKEGNEMAEEVYLLSAFSLQMLNLPAEAHFESLADEEAAEILSECGFISAIGHDSSASFISKRLSLDVEANRQRICLESGDEAIVFQLGERLEEGQVLSEQEIAEIPVSFIRARII